MVIQVRERTIEEIEDKLGEMNTPLNKITYLESALKATSFSMAASCKNRLKIST